MKFPLLFRVVLKSPLGSSRHLKALPLSVSLFASFAPVHEHPAKRRAPRLRWRAGDRRPPSGRPLYLPSRECVEYAVASPRAPFAESRHRFCRSACHRTVASAIISQRQQRRGKRDQRCVNRNAVTRLLAENHRGARIIGACMLKYFPVIW